MSQTSLPEHWLIFRLSALGDVTLTTGPLRCWHEQYGWHFTVLTKTEFAPIFTDHPAVREVITPSVQELSLPGIFPFLRGLASSYAGSGLMDLHGTPRSRLLGCFWRGPVLRCPKQGLERRLFLFSKNSILAQRLRRYSIPQRYMLAETANPPRARELRPVIYLRPEERIWARERLRRAGLSGRPVALHPYAAHSCKTWPGSYWRKLAQSMDNAGIPWFAMGKGSGVFSFGEKRDFSNKTTPRELCALLAAARGLVSGDSGPVHLASAVGTPVLALFGPTTAEWGFFPTNPQDVIMEKNFSCRPCSLHGADSCRKNGVCLQSILPEEVLPHILALSAAC